MQVNIQVPWIVRVWLCRCFNRPYGGRAELDMVSWVVYLKVNMARCLIFWRTNKTDTPFLLSCFGSVTEEGGEGKVR